MKNMKKTYEENLLLFSRLFEEGFNRPNIKTKKFTSIKAK